jgi:hypothetical protein
MKHVQKLPNWTFCGKPVSSMGSVVGVEEVSLDDPDLCKLCKKGIIAIESPKSLNPNLKHVPRTANRAFCGKLLTRVKNPVSKEEVNLEDPDLCGTCRRGVGAPSFFKILLVWRPERHEEGLSRVIEAPRGVNLFANGVEVASIISYRLPPSGADEPPQYKGWIWSAGNEPSEKLPFKLPRANTCGHPVDDLEVAKAKCKAWVKKKLEEAREASSVQNSTVEPYGLQAVGSSSSP